MFIMRKNYHQIVFLTGAGISAESGLATFRGSNGLWNGWKPDEVASLKGFLKNKERALEFYNTLRAEVFAAKPNVVHLAIAKLQKEYNSETHILTQNIDTLHEKAKSKNVYHIHGQINHILCSACGKTFATWENVSAKTVCPYCGKKGELRPDIVFFGEEIKFGRQIKKLLQTADLFIAVGTSGTVPPASFFVSEAQNNGAETLAFNFEMPENGSLFDKVILGSASETLPLFVKSLLGENDM